MFYFPIPASIAIAGGGFGLGNGAIRLRGVQCTGTETNITTCREVRSIFTSFCNHFDDAGVLCPSMFEQIVAIL